MDGWTELQKGYNLAQAIFCVRLRVLVPSVSIALTGRNSAVWTSCANAQPTNSTVPQVVHVDISKISSCTGAARQVPKNEHSLGEKNSTSIYPKSGKIGGDYLAAQKNWRKKCVNLDDKILRQKCVNHPNVMNFVTK